MEGSSKKLKFETLDDGERVQFMDVDTNRRMSDAEAMDTDPELVIEVAPRQAEEVLKLLLERDEPKRTAALLATFEQTSSRLRRFVQSRQLWMQLFQKTFPEHYADAVMTYPLNDGTGRHQIVMNRRVMEILDVHSLRPYRMETYWKRYYELLTRIALPYGRDPDVTNEWDIATDETSRGIQIWIFSNPAIFYFAVLTGLQTYDQLYEINLLTLTMLPREFVPDASEGDYTAYLGNHFNGLIDDSASERGKFIWKTYNKQARVNNWVEFQFSKDLKKMTIQFYNFYARTILRQDIQFGTQKDWRGVKYDSEPDEFDTCFLYRHRNPAENVVFVTPAYFGAGGLDNQDPVYGEHSKWAYKINLSVPESRSFNEITRLTDDVIGDQIMQTGFADDEDEGGYFFRWQNFYKTKEYFYNHDERRLYISELPENKTTLVSSPIWCEHCDDTKAAFAEKNKGVLFCSRECQQQYYK